MIKKKHMQHSWVPCSLLGCQALVICISLPHLSLAVTTVIYPWLTFIRWTHPILLNRHPMNAPNGCAVAI